MTKRRFSVLTGLSLWLLISLGTAFSQSLERLAPANTVLSLGWSSESAFIDTLGSDYAALDWMKAADTLDKLSAVLSEAGEFTEYADIIEFFSLLDSQTEAQADALSEAYDFCPALEDLLPEFESFEGSTIPFDSLLSVGISSFNPIPSVTALLDIDPSYAPLMVETREVLLGCLEDSGELEVSTLDQDGVTLYVLGDASDFPVVIGNVDTIFFAGTNPESLRSIVRQLNGATEPSFADSRMAQEMNSRFEASGNALSFSLDLAQIADTLEGFTGFVIDSPETEYLVNRGLSVMRTLSGVAGQISATDGGLVAESIWTINPEGGDPALADYILCDTCNVAQPFLAPSGSIAVSSAHIPWRELYRYAETWVDDLQALTGEQADLKDFVRDEFGFDMDVAFFNWLGSDFHTVVLEPISTDIRTLIYEPGQFSFVPVSSAEAAQAGLDELGEHLLPAFFDLMNEFDFNNEFSDALNMSGLESTLALRPYTYEGIDIQRVQMSINSDFAYAIVGNYFVVGSPARSVEIAIDTFMGGRTISRDDLYRKAISNEATPKDRTMFSVSEDQSSMYGLADILSTVSQPLAFGVATGLDTLSRDFNDFFDDGSSFDPEPYYADIFGLEAESFSAPGDIVASIQEDDLDNLDYLSNFYELNDLSPGDTVTVTLSSDSFDSYLYLIDTNTEEYLHENDDSIDDFAVSELSFVVEEGRNYWVEATSYDGYSTGEYVLTVLVTEGDAMMDDSMVDTDMMAEEHSTTLSFAELLDFFDLLPASVTVLADHLSTSESFSTIDGETVYSRSVTFIRW